MGITDLLTGRSPRRRRSRAETIAPRLNVLVSRFLLARRAAGRAPATVEWYESRLRRFAAAVQDAPADRVSADDVRAFLVAIKTGTAGRATADSYVEGHRKAIAALYTWAVRERTVGHSPCASVPKFKGDRRLPEVYAAPDVRSLVASQPNTRAGVRNAAAMLLLYDTGIRVGELVTTTIDDLDLDRGELKVRGKSRRERVVPLSPAVRSVLVSYMQRCRPAELFAKCDRLFVARDGGPMSTGAVRQWLRRAKRRAGVDARVHPHGFRSTFATTYLRNGGDPFTAQAIMGIRSAQVMAGYVNMALRDVHERHTLASPVERMIRGA